MASSSTTDTTDRSKAADYDELVGRLDERLKAYHSTLAGLCALVDSLLAEYHEVKSLTVDALVAANVHGALREREALGIAESVSGSPRRRRSHDGAHLRLVHSAGSAS